MLEEISHIQVGETRYPLAFTLNVMEAIQEKYGSIDKWSTLIQKPGEPDIKALKFFITEAINEAIDIENEKTGQKRKAITLKQAGRILTEYGISNAAQVVTSTISKSVNLENMPKNEQSTKN
jgi:hypothetical protein